MDNRKDITKQRLSEIFQGETQEITAKKLNTTQSNVSKWVNVNSQQLPAPDMLRDISKTYKVSVDWLLGISDRKEIDGVTVEKLTYEQVTKIIDWLIEMGTITIPDLQQLKDNQNGYIGPDDEEVLSKRPNFDSDYMKVNDRVLSYMLRRRVKFYELGKEVVEFWKDKTLANYRDVPLLRYTGNMQNAIDAHRWVTFTDGDWVELVRKLEAMTEEERAAMIERAKKNEKDGKHNG